MKNIDFPEKTFIEGLKVTKKVKASMKPFIEEFSKLNFPYIFESFRILAAFITDPKTDPLIKLNSLYAIRCIMLSCEYVPLAMIEAYAIPFLVQAAGHKPNQSDMERGADLFLNVSSAGEQIDTIKAYGTSYVKLAYQILYVGSIIKPRFLYYKEETKDPSIFSLEFKTIYKSLKNPPAELSFFKESPENLRKKYQQNLASFDEKQQQAYSQFVTSIFLEQTKQNFKNLSTLDTRQLYKTGDFLICQDSLDLINQFIHKGKNVKNVSAGIQYISDLVRAGVVQVWMWAHDNQNIKYLVRGVDEIDDGGDMSLARGEQFLSDKKGTPEEKKALYMQFLTALEFWAGSFLKSSFFDPSKESNLRKYYKFFKETRGYEFPRDPLLKNFIQESQENFNVFKTRNKMVLTDLKQSGELQQQKDDPILKSKKQISSKKEVQSLKMDSKKSVPPVDQKSLKAAEASNKSIPKQEQSKKSVPVVEERSMKDSAVRNQASVSNNSMPKQEQSNKNIKSSKNNIMLSSQEEKKQIKKFETPEGDDSLSEQSVKNGEAFKTRLEQVEKIMGKLKKSEKNLPRKMEYILQQKALLQKNLQTANIEEDQLEDIMGRYFDLAEVIEKIEPSYTKYKRNQINFQAFCKTFETGFSRKNSTQNLMKESKQSQRVVQYANPQDRQNQSNKSIERNIQNQSNKTITDSRKATEKKIEEAASNKMVSQSQKFMGASKKSLGQMASDQQEQLQRERLEQTRKIQEEAFKKKKQTNKSINSDQRSFQRLQNDRVESLLAQNVDVNQQMSKKSLKMENNERVQFQNSHFVQSRFSQKHVEQEADRSFNLQKEKVVESRIVSNASLRVATLKQEEVEVEDDKFLKVKSFRKFNEAPLNAKRFQTHNQMNELPDQITYTYKQEGEQKQEKSLYDEIKSQKQSGKKIPNEMQQEPEYLDDDEIIQSPSLNPLDNSFHDDEESYGQKLKKKPKISFKDAISNNDYIMKGTKKQNLFWLKSEAESIIKPAGNNQKRSRIQSNVSVPQLLEQKNRKYESDIKYLEENKDRQIRDLENKLLRAENEKETIKEQLRIKQSQIKSIQEFSESGGRSRYNIQQAKYVEDQNYVMKKLSAAAGAGLNNSSYSHSYRKKDFEKASNLENLTSSCKVINTKKYNEYFRNFTKEKDKKMHLKNKQLLYKDTTIEVGCTGYREGSAYKITCYLTPEQDIVLLKIGVECDDNLKIQHQVTPNLKIAKRVQQKLHFFIEVVSVPYHIPYVYLHYTVSGEDRKTRVFLPCAFHKFFKIEQTDQSYFTDQFENSSGMVQRGEEIPYSKRALKTLDSILEYLPHIAKLNKGNTDRQGEICYGGNALYKKCLIPLKICVKPNQFLYIKALKTSRSQEEQQILDFYIATLNHFFMKDIAWD